MCITTNWNPWVGYGFLFLSDTICLHLWCSSICRNQRPNLRIVRSLPFPQLLELGRDERLVLRPLALGQPEHAVRVAALRQPAGPNADQDRFFLLPLGAANKLP